MERIGSDWLGGLYTGSERRAKVRHIKVSLRLGAERSTMVRSDSARKGKDSLGTIKFFYWYGQASTGGVRCRMQGIGKDR